MTTKISSDESEPADKDGSKSQSNLYVYKYLTASTWDALCDKNKSDEEGEAGPNARPSEGQEL